MLQTVTQEHTNSMAMLKVFIVKNVPFHKAKHYAAYTAVLDVCVYVCVCVCECVCVCVCVCVSAGFVC